MGNRVGRLILLRGLDVKACVKLIKQNFRCGFFIYLNKNMINN